jgi:hypothetical protein
MTTEISAHSIKWWVKTESVKELSEFEVDRIEQLIADGYTQGEINMAYTDSRNRDHVTNGWWEIVNWQDIALELYNALKDAPGPITDSRKKAITRFDKHWE